MKTLPQISPLRTAPLASRFRGTPGVAVVILLAILAAVLSASLLKAQGSSPTPVMPRDPASVDRSSSDVGEPRHDDHLFAAYEFRGGQLRGRAAWSADQAHRPGRRG